MSDFSVMDDRFDFSNLSGVTTATISSMLAAAQETTVGAAFKTTLSLDLLDGVTGNAQGAIELYGVHKNDLSSVLFLTNLDHALLNQLEFFIAR